MKKILLTLLALFVSAGVALAGSAPTTAVSSSGLSACSDADYTTGTSTSCAGTPANAKVELDKKAAVNASTTGSAGSLKSPATTGVTTITGPGAGTTRNLTIPDADATLTAAKSVVIINDAGTITVLTCDGAGQMIGRNAANNAWECKTTLSMSAISMGGAYIDSTGYVTGLMPSKVLTIASGVHDGANDAAILTDSGESFTTSQFVGMTLYNITDASSCTVTANNGTTITCTLAGGTDNNWDTNDVWQVGPGPQQSGSWFYVVGASTIRHPATVGYTVCYESDATAALTVDFASDTMIFQGVLDSAVQVNSAGHYITSSGSTTGDFQCIHNKSATEAQGKGKRGTWTKEADD